MEGTQPTCTNCGHAALHNSPAGAVADGCSERGCACGYYVPVTEIPASTPAPAELAVPSPTEGTQAEKMCDCPQNIPYFGWFHDKSCRLYRASGRAETRKLPECVYSNDDFEPPSKKPFWQLQGELADRERQLRAALDREADLKAEIERLKLSLPGTASLYVPKAAYEALQARMDALERSHEALLKHVRQYWYEAKHNRTPRYIAALADAIAAAERLKK